MRELAMVKWTYNGPPDYIFSKGLLLESRRSIVRFSGPILPFSLQLPQQVFLRESSQLPKSLASPALVFSSLCCCFYLWPLFVLPSCSGPVPKWPQHGCGRSLFAYLWCTVVSELVSIALQNCLFGSFIQSALLTTRYRCNRRSEHRVCRREIFDSIDFGPR